MSIECRRLTKRFHDFYALDDVSVHVPDGELLALLGPSGSGKTTLLRVIAGLDKPDSGEVLLHDVEVTGRDVRDRNIGFVFQHFALFGHMNVYDNVAFALRIRKRPETEVRARVEELLELIQLHGFETRTPAQLSGGQRQRVALARALSARPRVLLLDEPFSALDAKVRLELRRWLRRLHDEIRTTCIFVTHDQEEAFELADRVLVFERGRIAQAGTAEVVWQQPASPFVLDFLGHGEAVTGSVLGDRLILPHGWLVLPAQHTATEGGAQTVWLRGCESVLEPELEGAPGLRLQVQRLRRSGARTQVDLRRPDGTLWRVEPERVAAGVAEGAQVRLVPGRVHVFAAG
jgi:sulfate transport system ATP-binding protein